MMLIMRKNRYRKSKNTYIRKENKILVSLIIIFLIGTVFGVVSIRFMDAEIIEHIEKISKSYVYIRSSQDIKEIFLSIFLPNTFIIVLLYLLNKISFLMPLIYCFPLFYGIGFGIFSFFLLKIAKKNSVKLLTFTVFQERFWPAVVLILVCLYIIKADACIEMRRLHVKYSFAEVILSVILMGFASGISSFVVFKLGVPILKRF